MKVKWGLNGFERYFNSDNRTYVHISDIRLNSDSIIEQISRTFDRTQVTDYYSEKYCLLTNKKDPNNYLDKI